jgi:hypothetical protein
MNPFSDGEDRTNGGESEFRQPWSSAASTEDQVHDVYVEIAERTQHRVETLAATRGIKWVCRLKSSQTMGARMASDECEGHFRCKDAPRDAIDMEVAIVRLPTVIALGIGGDENLARPLRRTSGREKPLTYKHLIRRFWLGGNIDAKHGARTLVPPPRLGSN